LFGLVLQTQLDLDTRHLKALNDGDLSTPGGIYDCTEAAHALQGCVNADIHPGIADDLQEQVTLM